MEINLKRLIVIGKAMVFAKNRFIDEDEFIKIMGCDSVEYMGILKDIRDRVEIIKDAEEL